MTCNISISIISSKPLSKKYASVVEDDFFYHFGDKYYPNIRVFTLDDVEDERLFFSTILSIYDEDSKDLYRYLADIEHGPEISIMCGDSLFGISRKIMLKAFGIAEKSAQAEWKPPLFHFVEESHFDLKKLEPLPQEGEYPGVIPGDPGWVRPNKVRRKAPGFPDVPSTPGAPRGTPSPLVSTLTNDPLSNNQ